MKKIAFSLAIAAAVLSTGFTYAAEPNPTKPSKLVKEAFSKEFAQIKDVKWGQVGKEGIYQANFSFNNEAVQAFFTEEGEFLGTNREVTKSQLPILIARELDKSYPDADIRSIFEYSMKDGLAYYVTIMTGKGAMIVKATSNGELTVRQRSK
jgi:hypothetical protein